MEETKKQCITTMEPGGETMKFGDPRWTDSSLNSSVTKNLRASLEEILPDVVSITSNVTHKLWDEWSDFSRLLCVLLLMS